MRKVNYIVLHCTATPQTTTVESIQHYWKNVLGWKRPGYHVIVKTDGQIVTLLPVEKLANGVKGYNQHSIHLGYVGGVDKMGRPLDNRTKAQKQTLADLVRKYHDLFPDALIQGHRDFPKVQKACPSFDVRSWLKEVELLKGKE